MDESDIENIKEVLNNEEKYHLKTGLKEPPKLVEDERNLTRKKIEKGKKIIISDVLDFYDSVNPKIGKKIRKIYKQNKNKIFLEVYSKDDVENYGEGYTLSEYGDLGVKGKKGRSIINLQNNYLTYYTTAHEFMHLLQFDLQKGKGNEYGNLEIDARFIEYLMGEYLEKKGVIGTVDKDNHNRANNDQYEDAIYLEYYRRLKELRDNNSEKETQESLLEEFSKKYFKGNAKEAKSKLDELEATGPNSLENRLRFVNAMVNVNKLVQEYEKDKKNKKNFRQAYSEIILENGPIGAKDFSGFFNKIKERKEQLAINEERAEKKSILKRASDWFKNKFDKKQKSLPEGTGKNESGTVNVEKRQNESSEVLNKGEEYLESLRVTKNDYVLSEKSQKNEKKEIEKELENSDENR